MLTVPIRPRTTDRTRRAGLVVAVYAGTVYLFFLGVLAFSAGFFADVGVPRTIDHGPGAPAWAAVVIDLVLLNLFAVQHTVMARPWFKRGWTRVVPPAAERATFVLAASLVLALLLWQWRPVRSTVWHVHGVAALSLDVAYGAGWALAIGSTYLIDHADLFGLRQAWTRLRGRRYRAPEFVERGLYRHIRHPLMTGFLIIFWATPSMTGGHLLFAATSTAYILVGIGFEERDLLRTLGAEYAAYRARVPALFPVRLGRRPRGR